MTFRSKRPAIEYLSTVVYWVKLLYWYQHNYEPLQRPASSKLYSVTVVYCNCRWGLYIHSTLHNIHCQFTVTYLQHLRFAWTNFGLSSTATSHFLFNTPFINSSMPIYYQSWHDTGLGLCIYKFSDILWQWCVVWQTNSKWLYHTQCQIPSVPSNCKLTVSTFYAQCSVNYLQMAISWCYWQRYVMYSKIHLIYCCNCMY